MKNKALVTSGMVVSLVFANGVFGQAAIPQKNQNSAVVKSAGITVDEARKIALKKVDGKIEEEFPLEDGGKVVVYVFMIRNAKNKVIEVQVEPTKGGIVYAEENAEYDANKP